MRLLNHKLTDEIIFDMESVGTNEALFKEKNFHLRAEALDDIEFKILGTDRLDITEQDVYVRGSKN